MTRGAQEPDWGERHGPSLRACAPGKEAVILFLGHRNKCQSPRPGLFASRACGQTLLWEPPTPWLCHLLCAGAQASHFGSRMQRDLQFKDPRKS